MVVSLVEVVVNLSASQKKSKFRVRRKRGFEFPTKHDVCLFFNPFVSCFFRLFFFGFAFLFGTGVLMRCWWLVSSECGVVGEKYSLFGWESAACGFVFCFFAFCRFVNLRDPLWTPLDHCCSTKLCINWISFEGYWFGILFVCFLWYIFCLVHIYTFKSITSVSFCRRSASLSLLCLWWDQLRFQLRLAPHFDWWLARKKDSAVMHSSMETNSLLLWLEIEYF